MTEGAYPIIVRATGWQRAGSAGLFVLFAVVYGGLGVAMLLGRNPNPIELGIAAGFAVACLGFFAAAWHSFIVRLVLERDSLSKEGLLGRRVLQRSQIAGTRTLNGNRRYRLIPSDPSAKAITFSITLLQNQAVMDWLDGVPDLDAQEVAAQFAVYEQDARYGATAEERHARLGLMQKIARVATWVSIGVGAWVVIWPEPYLVAVGIAAAFPLIAVALNIWSGNLLTFGLEKQNDFRPSLLMMIGAPALALMRAATDFHILDFPAALKWVSVVTLAALIALILRAGWARIGGAYVFPTMVLTFIYCFSTLILADVLLDTAQPQRFQTRVVSKHWESGKGGSRYYLSVEPWGPVKRREDLRVSEQVYQQAQSGDWACPYLGAGRLGLRWYDVRPCQP